LYVAEYFDNLKQETAKELGCDKDEIYYVSIDPDIPNEICQDLKKAGVYDFHKLLDEVITYAKRP
jgi:glucose-6-phosphate 1-dehydrogenase